MDPNDKDRLEGISYRIESAERKPPAKSEPPQGGRNGGIDFVGSIVICGIVGALADRAFKTAPWFTLGMVAFGFAVGMVTVWRALKDNKE